MAPKRRRRASARKGAKKGGSMGRAVLVLGGGYHICVSCMIYDRIMKRVETIMYTCVIKCVVV